MAAYCLPTHLVLTQSRMRPWATPPTPERRFLCTAARPGTQGSRTDGWGEIDRLVAVLCVSANNNNNKLVLILTRHTLARAGLANRPY